MAVSLDGKTLDQTEMQGVMERNWRALPRCDALPGGGGTLFYLNRSHAVIAIPPAESSGLPATALRRHHCVMLTDARIRLLIHDNASTRPAAEIIRHACQLQPAPDTGAVMREGAAKQVLQARLFEGDDDSLHGRHR